MAAHAVAGPLAALLLIAAPAPSEDGGPDSRAGVSWRDLVPHVRSSLAVAPEGGRWVLQIIPTGSHDSTDEDAADAGLPAAVSAAVSAARDDLAWLAGEVLTARRREAGGDAGVHSRLTDSEMEALLAEGAFSDPLRLYLDAALRAAGISCSDCLSDLRPSRDVTWREVREYAAAFIYVEEVDDEGRVLLRVGRNESALPPLGRCDPDLAGALYALVQALIRQAPAFPQAVQGSLNQEILSLGDLPPEAARERLNERVPERVLRVGAVQQEILSRLPGALDRHRLRCGDCPTP